MTHSKTLEQLKNLTLQKNQDFSIAANYFLDHLGENVDFMKKGKRVTEQLEFYTQLLTYPLKNHYGNETTLHHIQLIHVKEYDFTHGSARLSNGRMVIMYYFDNIRTGMAFSSSFQDNKTDFFRLSVFIPDKNSLSEKVILPSTIPKTCH